MKDSTGLSGIHADYYTAHPSKERKAKKTPRVRKTPQVIKCRKSYLLKIDTVPLDDEMLNNRLNCCGQPGPKGWVSLKKFHSKGLTAKLNRWAKA